jgi:MFS family permease
MTAGPEPSSSPATIPDLDQNPATEGNAYRLALSTPGALRFAVPGILARFPIGMMGISILLFISAVTHRYDTAGALSATSALGYAMAAPQLARAADRIGQRPILAGCGALCAVSGTLFVVCALHSAPLWALVALAAAMGAGTPAIGSMVRARWSGLLAGSELLPTAFAFESIADEVIFIAGPIIATFLATGVASGAGVICSLVLICGGSAALALSRKTEPGRDTGPRPTGSALFIGPVAIITLINACCGAMWGSIDIATVSFASDENHRGLAGLLLAGYGIGSVVAGVVYGARKWKAPLPRILHAATALMAIGIAPMLLVHNVYAAVLVLCIAGATSCPALIVAMLLVQNGVPSSRRTEALAWQSTGIWLGVALGSTVGGRLTDGSGPHAVYAFASICGLVSCAIATIGRRRVGWQPAEQPAEDQLPSFSPS